MIELPDVGCYERHGVGSPVMILSNPQADPRWWAPPYITALVDAGYEAVPFIHTGPGFAPAEVASDVAAFLEYLDAGPVRLLGWSQGAAIAQETAVLRPALVAALVLVASYGRQNVIDQVLQEAWRVLADAGSDLDPVRLA